MLVSLAVLGLIAGLTVPSIVASVEKSKRQALLKEGFQLVSEIIQNGYMNGDFNEITTWDINLNSPGSIADYFGKKFNYSKQCLASDFTSSGCSDYSYAPLRHSCRWVFPNGMKISCNEPNQVNNTRILLNVYSDAYKTTNVISMTEKNPTVVQFVCNISDTPINPYSGYGGSTAKPGMCTTLYSGFGVGS